MPDLTGSVLIDADGATRVDIEAHVVGDPPGARPVFGASVLARESSPMGQPSNPSHYIAAVKPGDVIAVIGTVWRDSGGTLHVRGTAERPLVLSTKPEAVAD